MIREGIRTAVIVVVTIVWAANFVAGLAVADYDPDPSVHAVFMSIVGGLLAIGAHRERHERQDSHKREDQ